MKFTDLSSAEFSIDPYPLYQRAREEGRLVACYQDRPVIDSQSTF
jgi:hypothetical protein